MTTRCRCLCHQPDSFHAGGGRCKTEPGTECVNGSIVEAHTKVRTDEEAERDRDKLKRTLLGPGGMAAHWEHARELEEGDWR